MQKQAAMKWSTPITIEEKKGYLQHGSPMLLMGSCFADNVGEYLRKAKFEIEINPFGTLYNPESIANALDRLISGREYRPEDLQRSGKIWYSYHHHGKFSSTSAEQTLRNINNSLERASAMLKRCERLILTFGTAYVYRLASTGETVANCHKQPAYLFERTLLSVDEIVTRWEKLLQRLAIHAPQCKIVFTISPIRHMSDGAHNNQLSKSTLLLAADRLCKSHSELCDYFPAYEIVLDELRDYRFYADDMAHPSPQAVAYIYEKLCDTYFTDHTRDIAELCLKIDRGLHHRPLAGTDNEGYQQFAQKLITQMRQTEQKEKNIDYNKEIEELKQLISQ